jgi:hypothetical protein
VGTHFWHARWDTDNTFTMTIQVPEEVDGANILKVNEEDLNIT